MDDSPYLDDPEEENLDVFGLYEGQCVGCDIYARVDDLGLCEECTGKLERDMIRERSWDHSATGWACPEEKREELRDLIIKEHGAKLELIAPSGGPASNKRKRRKRRRKRPRE